MEAGGDTNRVLVIGARGVLGALTAGAFADAGWTVRSGARRPRAGQVEVDLDRPESIAAALDQRELVVNAVPHSRLLAERHVLEHGGTLINISALPAAASRALRAVAAGARGTVVMNAGLAPGVTAVVAAELLRLHPDADELELVFTLSSATPRGPASVDFIHRGLTAVARHRTTAVPLPEPFGTRVCLGFGEGDAGWLGGVAEGCVVRLYLCFAEVAAHERLLAMNGAMTEPSRPFVAAHRPGPGSPPSAEPVAHWVAVLRGERRLAARTVQCCGDFLHAARSAVVFAEALAVRELAGGCFDPEELFSLASVERPLSEAGINVTAHDGPVRADKLPACHGRD